MPDHLLDDAMAQYMAEQEAKARSPLLGVGYDKMYPKNLRNILQKLDKNARGEYVPQLMDQSGVAIPRSAGHTVFPLSPEVRKRILDEGLPLFSGASAPAGVIGRSVYPYDGTSVLNSLETHGNRAIAPVGDEIKEWTPPKWQDQAGDWLSQKLMDYGMPRNAAVSDANRISSLLGFLPPIAAHDGGVDIGEGYRSGDYGQMGAGAIGVAGAALPFAGRALSRGAAAAEIKAIPAPTPWGSTDEFLSKIRSAPQPYVHPLNVPEAPKPREPLSAEASRAREEQIIDEARQFMTPSRDQDQAFRAFGTYEGKRWMSPTQELDDAIETRNVPSSHRYPSFDPDGKTKASGLLNSIAKDLERHSARNEHIPAISERAQAMADRARSVAKTMDADEATRLRRLHMKWDSTDKYVDDAYRFKEPTQVRWLDGDHPFVMDDNTLHDILRHNYGANYQDPESWPAAYKKFWADERAMRAAGKPTWHALEARKEALAEADYLKRETGVDAFKASEEEVDDALDKLRSSHKKYIDDVTSRLDAYESKLKTPETSLGDAIKRQAVPATLATGAVLGGQAAYNYLRNYGQRTSPDAQASYPAGYDDGGAVIERSKFTGELSDPTLRQRLAALAYRETGGQGQQAQQAFLETVFNRAAARGKTIAETISGRDGYYPNVSLQPVTASKLNGISPLIDTVMAGSNLSNGATGNASGSVGFNGGQATYAVNGERFGREGPDLSWTVPYNALGGRDAQPADVTTSSSKNSSQSPIASVLQRISVSPVSTDTDGNVTWSDGTMQGLFNSQFMR